MNKEKRKKKLEKKVRILEERLEKTKLDALADSEKEAALESETESALNKILESEPNSALKTESDTILEVASDSNLDENLDSETASDANNTENTEIETEISDAPNYDIVLNVKPQKVSQIKSQIIDGKKCIIIPIDDDEQAKVNGVNALL